MKHLSTILVSLLLLIAFNNVNAQNINGIRIECDTPVEVFINGMKVCNPVQSCMIANLGSGTYHIEAYTADYITRELLFSKNVRYSGYGIKEIILDGIRHIGGNNGMIIIQNAMDEHTFSAFLNSLDKAIFDSDKKSLIESAVKHSQFYTSQVITICKEHYNFDSDRLWLLKTMYPAIIDKEKSFMLQDLLTFSSSKQELEKYINNYYIGR